ncbi:MAG: SCO family protein [Candidatus Binatia bacterium]
MTHTRRSRSSGIIKLWILGLGALFFLMIAGSVLLLGTQLSSTHSSALPVLGEAPEFHLTERSGAPFSRANLAGSVWVADFIFTRCPGMCPLLSTRMATLQQQRQGEQGRPIRLVSFSVDPEWDTPERLREYAEKYHAHPHQWVFLTGPTQTMTQLIIQGFRLSVAPAQAGSQEPILHSDRLVLVDPSFRIRGYYHGSDAEDFDKLQRDIKVLLHE